MCVPVCVFVCLKHALVMHVDSAPCYLVSMNIKQSGSAVILVINILLCLPLCLETEQHTRKEEEGEEKRVRQKPGDKQTAWT